MGRSKKQPEGDYAMTPDGRHMPLADENFFLPEQQMIVLREKLGAEIVKNFLPDEPQGKPIGAVMPTEEPYIPHEKPVSLGGGPAGVAVGVADAVPHVAVAEIVAPLGDANAAANAFGSTLLYCVAKKTVPPEATAQAAPAPPKRSGAMRCREPEAVAIERIVKVMKGHGEAMTDKQLADAPKNTPSGQGIYLARTMDCRWWNLLVQIEGEAPYLYFHAWHRRTYEVIEGRHPSDFWFGPKIKVPEVTP